MRYSVSRRPLRGFDSGRETLGDRRRTRQRLMERAGSEGARRSLESEPLEHDVYAAMVPAPRPAAGPHAGTCQVVCNEAQSRSPAHKWFYNGPQPLGP